MKWISVEQLSTCFSKQYIQNINGTSGHCQLVKNILIFFIRRVILSPRPLLWLVLLKESHCFVRVSNSSFNLVVNNKLWGVNNCLKPQYRKPLACLAVSRRKDPVIFEPRKLRYICRICILKIKVSTILGIIRRNYHLTTQN